mgnify:CR=1 FL=1
MKTLGIIGAGDLGQQIADYAINDNHYDGVVFFDDYYDNNTKNKIKVVGKLVDIEKAFNDKVFDELIIGIGYKHLEFKKKIYEQFKDKITFGKIIHSSSIISKSANIEEGCVIYPGCIIDINSVIKANTIINIGCTISHDSEVGKHCFLSPRVAIAGFVKINDECTLGINSTIIDNITITSKTKIGASALIIESITENGLYIGIPAKKYLKNDSI